VRSDFRASLRSLSSLSHLVDWGLNPITNPCDILSTCLADCDCESLAGLFALFAGTIRTSFPGNYSHVCVFCALLTRVHVFCSVRHILRECYYFSDVCAGLASDRLALYDSFATVINNPADLVPLIVCSVARKMLEIANR
jgi:hypothetical protein